MKDCFGHRIPRSSIIIRATELQQFLNCPRQWFLLSHNGLNLTPAEPSLKMRLGTIWHKAMEHYYDPEVPDAERLEHGICGLELGMAEDLNSLEASNSDWFYTPEFQESMEKGQKLLRTLLEGYPRWAKEEASPADNTFEPVATEKRYVVPIYTPQGYRSKAYLAAKLDGVVRDSQGRLWVLEHKTRGVSSKVDDPQGMSLDLQMGLQLICLRRVMEPHGQRGEVSGVIYNLVRRQMPGPRVRSPIYGRHKVFRTALELGNLELFLYKTYRQMRQTIQGGLENARYNPQVWAGGYCTWGCPAMSICENLSMGLEVRQALDLEFRRRDKDIWQMLEEEMTD